MPTILAADIGGTQSRFALFAFTDGVLRLETAVRLPTAESSSFDDLLTRLRDSDPAFAPDRADVMLAAIAGAVEDDRRCRPVNIAWDVDMERVAQRFKLRRVGLINDFVAQAYACRTAVTSQAQPVLSGRADPNGVLAVMGAGTGLGKCALVPILDGEGPVRALPVPSEGGHTYFPFLTDEEFAFQRFVRAATGKRQVITEMVVSGLGLRLTHRFLTGQDLAPAEVAATFGAEDSPTLQWASRFYGRACREYALEVLPTAGLYVSGGVAARNPALALHPNFAQEFRSSETHAGLLGRIPVWLNVNQDSGLWGAAFCGAQRFLFGER